MQCTRPSDAMRSANRDRSALVCGDARTQHSEGYLFRISSRIQTSDLPLNQMEESDTLIERIIWYNTCAHGTCLNFKFLNRCIKLNNLLMNN